MIEELEEYLLDIELPGNQSAKIKLIRILAPITIQQIVKRLPISTRIVKFGKQLLINLPLKVKIDKTSKNVKAGDVAYWPISQALCIYLEETKIPSPVIIVGKVVEGMEILKQIPSGAGVTLKKGRAA
ncbi:MAG: cyclophilin-like fold protein [archaeon GB-1867-005]|nr:cyclophilin-like fold protein [Candidatus Culexmicrobium cathedralense]